MRILRNFLGKILISYCTGEIERKNDEDRRKFRAEEQYRIGFSSDEKSTGSIRVTDLSINPVDLLA